MWVKRMPCGDLINLEQLAKIQKSKVKIFGTYPNGDQVTLGEFWTTRQCDMIFRSIMQNLGADGFIIVKDTRDGMRKL